MKKWNYMTFRTDWVWQSRPCPAGCCHSWCLYGWPGSSGGTPMPADTGETNSKSELLFHKNPYSATWLIIILNNNIIKKQAFYGSTSWFFNFISSQHGVSGLLPLCTQQLSGLHPCRFLWQRPSTSLQPDTPSPPTTRHPPGNYIKH